MSAVCLRGWCVHQHQLGSFLRLHITSQTCLYVKTPPEARAALNFSSGLQDDEEDIMIGRDAHPGEDDFEHGLQDMHGAGDPGIGMVGEALLSSCSVRSQPASIWRVYVSPGRRAGPSKCRFK